MNRPEHSDPKVLEEAAAGTVPHEAAKRKKEVEEVNINFFTYSLLLSCLVDDAKKTQIFITLHQSLGCAD